MREESAIDLDTARKLYRFTWKNSSKRQMLACGIALLTLPLTLGPIELQRLIIDDAVANKDVEYLFTLITIYLGVIVAQQIVKFAYNYERGKIAERLSRVMRAAIVADPSIGEIDDGAAIAMITGEVEPVGGFGGDAFAQPVTEGGVLIAVFGYMLYTEFWLALVAIAVFIPQALATPLAQGYINEQSASRVSEVRATGDAILEVKTGSGSSKTRALRHVRNLFDIRLLIFKLKFGLKALLNLMDHTADLAILGAGGYMVIQGQTEVGVVVAFLSGLGQLRSPWRTLISYFRVASDATLKFGLISDKIDLNGSKYAKA